MRTANHQEKGTGTPSSMTGFCKTVVLLRMKQITASLFTFPLLVFLLCAAPVRGDETGEETGMTLEEAFALALEKDAQYEADMHGAGARQADGWRKIAGYGPTLSLSGSYSKGHDELSPDAESEMNKSEARFYEKELTLSFEQPLFDAVKAASFRQGRNQLNIAELKQKTSHDDLRLRVSTAFYEVLSTRESLRIATKQTKAINKQLQNATDRLKLGFGTITDQYEAEARYRQSAAAEISRKLEWKRATTELATLLGGITPPLADPAPEYEFVPLTNDLEYWLDVADTNSTALINKRLELKAAQHTYSSNQSRFLPSLAFYADYSRNEPDDSLAGYGEDRTEFDVGLVLRVNLLDGGGDVAATIAAQRRMKEADALLRTSLQKIKSSVESLYDSINDTTRLISAYASASEASRLALESVEAAYLEGVKALPEVLDRQQDYYGILGQYHTAQYSYMTLIC
ncbi:TolC family protein [Desulforhopalus singaporensis]|nr:TolC family protein [Desulforhopalus singaporensis]